MFIDEIYESILIENKGKLTSAHIEVCNQKLNPKDPSFTDVKRIENGYQLFRKRHPEFPADSFRRHCYIRLSKGGQNKMKAANAFRLLGWTIEPEWESIGR